MILDHFDESDRSNESAHIGQAAQTVPPPLEEPNFGSPLPIPEPRQVKLPSSILIKLKEIASDDSWDKDVAFRTVTSNLLVFHPDKHAGLGDLTTEVISLKLNS